MFSYGKSRTEEQRAFSERRAKRARIEREEAEAEKAENMARQKAQRLAQKAADEGGNG